MYAEFGVGVLLVVLGGGVLRRLLRERIHFHIHEHEDGARHFHAHSHAEDTQSHDPKRHRHAHADGLTARVLLVGAMHGVAGSAALMLLAIEPLHSVPMGIVYIALFSVGSLAGMALLSILISLPLEYAANRATALLTGLQSAIGLGTVTLGGAMIYGILVP